MAQKEMVLLKSYAVIDGGLRSANEGPIEVTADWAENARELGLLAEFEEVVEPQTGDDAEAKAEAEAEAEAEAASKAKADKK